MPQGVDHIWRGSRLAFRHGGRCWCYFVLVGFQLILLYTLGFAGRTLDCFSFLFFFFSTLRIPNDDLASVSFRSTYSKWWNVFICALSTPIPNENGNNKSSRRPGDKRFRLYGFPLKSARGRERERQWGSDASMWRERVAMFTDPKAITSLQRVYSSASRHKD